MTVAQLTEILANYPDNMPIYIEHPMGDDGYVYTFLLGVREEDNSIAILFGD